MSEWTFKPKRYHIRQDRLAGRPRRSAVVRRDELEHHAVARVWVRPERHTLAGRARRCIWSNAERIQRRHRRVKVINNEGDVFNPRSVVAKTLSPHRGVGHLDHLDTRVTTREEGGAQILALDRLLGSQPKSVLKQRTRVFEVVDDYPDVVDRLQSHRRGM